MRENHWLCVAGGYDYKRDVGIHILVRTPESEGSIGHPSTSNIAD